MNENDWEICIHNRTKRVEGKSKPSEENDCGLDLKVHPGPDEDCQRIIIRHYRIYKTQREPDEVHRYKFYIGNVMRVVAGKKVSGALYRCQRSDGCRAMLFMSKDSVKRKIHMLIVWAYHECTSGFRNVNTADGVRMVHQFVTDENGRFAKGPLHIYMHRGEYNELEMKRIENKMRNCSVFRCAAQCGSESRSCPAELFRFRNMNRGGGFDWRFLNPGGESSHRCCSHEGSIRSRCLPETVSPLSTPSVTVFTEMVPAMGILGGGERKKGRRMKVEFSRSKTVIPGECISARPFFKQMDFDSKFLMKQSEADMDSSAQEPSHGQRKCGSEDVGSLWFVGRDEHREPIPDTVFTIPIPTDLEVGGFCDLRISWKMDNGVAYSSVFLPNAFYVEGVRESFQELVDGGNANSVSDCGDGESDRLGFMKMYHARIEREIARLRLGLGPATQSLAPGRKRRRRTGD